jgi:methyltransferase (TIGR00027 family)
MTEHLIRSVSDTANWVAYHRATESERPDAIFRDPYARRLAGRRGELVGRKLHQNAWAIAIRTYLFDEMVRGLLSREAVEMIVNLAAGLDSRPYRLELSSSLRWVEVDLPEIIYEKQKILSAEKPRCQLEVVAQHLADQGQRRALFAQLNQRAEQIAVMSEGLLVYLDEEKVTTLAADLYAQPHFNYWLVEVVSPKVLAWINRKWQRYFQVANAPMKFAPSNWRSFYRCRGWEVMEFRDMAKTARELNREPRMMKVFRVIGQMFPDWNQKQEQAWESGVALLRRGRATSGETNRK